MSTVPIASFGEVAEIDESLLNVYDAAAVVPNITVVRSVKPLPVIVTTVPPRVVPDDVEMAVTTGFGATYVYVPSAVPLGVVTTTFADPAALAGVIMLITLSVTTVTPVADVPPMVTPLAPVKPVPTIVIDVPPAVVPEVGEIVYTAGSIVVTGLLSKADADEVTIPRTTRVRQKTRKKVLMFIYIPAQDTSESPGPEGVVPDGVVPPFAAAFCPFPW